MKKRIGIIEGQGTGRQVAAIFRRIIKTVLKKEKKEAVDFVSFYKTYQYYPHTFASLLKKYSDKSQLFFNKIVTKEFSDLKYFYTNLYNNSLGIFRTAINAEALYYLRRDIKKIKFMILEIKHKNFRKNIFFIRDQLQGFYTNHSLKSARDSIVATYEFRQKNFNYIGNFIRSIVKTHKLSEYDLVYLYKFHLFGLEINRMIKYSIRTARLKPSGQVEIMQPDTGFDIFLNHLTDKFSSQNIVVVTGNEIGDMLLEALVHNYKLGNMFTIYTVNYAFINKPKPLEVLQTMHGSADFLRNKNQLNPFATIKAASYALERWLGVVHSIAKTKKILSLTIKEDFVTKDLNGDKTTDEVVQYFLDHW